MLALRNTDLLLDLAKRELRESMGEYDPSDLNEILDYQPNFFDILDNEICRLCSCNPCQCVDDGGDSD